MNIIANLIAFTSFVTFLDVLVAWFATQVGHSHVNFTVSAPINVHLSSITQYKLETTIAAFHS
jgi:hypothetical protein